MPNNHPKKRVNQDTLKKRFTIKQSQSTRRKPLITALVAVVAVVVLSFGIYSYVQNAPIEVTINGEQKTIQGPERSLNGLLENEVVVVAPGNYLAVDGSVIRHGNGTRCTATLNGEATDDLSVHLKEGDVITLENGEDITEPYSDSDPIIIQPGVDITGVGAVHIFTDKGAPGEKIERTGNESNITIEIVTKEPTDKQLIRYNVDTKGEKVIALTFDDGPWEKWTKEVLDVLEDNGALATFFTVGNRIPNDTESIQRMAKTGHEISTHTYDHAAGSGRSVSLDLMSTEERRDEVINGLQAITDITGKPASTIFRAPGGNFSKETAADLSDLVTAEIGWNIDTTDWKRPDANTIANRIKSAEPGDIILMHDGGGDRANTVEALKIALPYLKEQGYEFTTVDDLIKRFPYQEAD